MLPIGSAEGAVTLPSGFTQSQVVVSTSPESTTDMELAPDGRLFVADKAGTVLIAKPNGRQTTFLNFSAKVDIAVERGLQALALDPKSFTNHYIYLYYTRKATSKSPAHNRVVRVTAKGNKVAAGSEKLIFRLPNQDATVHMGGMIGFGKDGKLYIASGDNNNAYNAQKLTSLLGKMHRINKDGTIPTDNPFYAKTSGNNRAIWALGLRNPFKFAVRPGTGTIFINDVGEATWEEINRLKKGANYGWPKHEGPSKDPPFVNPVFAYKHGNTATTGCAITGGAFYKPATAKFPKRYVGDYFFSNYCSGWIRSLDPATGKVTKFASGQSSEQGSRDLEESKDGSLYVLAGSRVVKIRYTGK